MRKLVVAAYSSTECLPPLHYSIYIHNNTYSLLKLSRTCSGDFDISRSMNVAF